MPDTTGNRTFLRVIIEENEPWARIRYQDGRMIVEGPLLTILQSISNTVGFSYSVVRSVDGKWGGLSKNGYTGMVGMLHRDEADFALGPFSVTEERIQVVHYTHPIFFDMNAILSSDSSIRSFEFHPQDIFTLRLWMAVVVTFAIFVAISNVTSHLWHLSYPNHVPAYLFLASLLGKGLPRLPEQKNSRILFFIWLIFCTFLNNFFLCQILSSMVAQDTHNVENLADVVKNEVLVPIMEYGSTNEARIMNSTDPIRMSLMRRIKEQQPPPVNVEGMGSKIIMDGVQKGKYAVIAQKYILETIVANRTHNVDQCAYHISAEDVGLAMMAMVTNKKLSKSISTAIDNWSTRLMDSGLHMYWLFWNKMQADKCFVKTSNNNFSQIKLSSLKLCFRMWVIGVCISFVAFLCEKVYHAYHVHAL